MFKTRPQVFKTGPQVFTNSKKQNFEKLKKYFREIFTKIWSSFSKFSFFEFVNTCGRVLNTCRARQKIVSENFHEIFYLSKLSFIDLAWSRGAASVQNTTANVQNWPASVHKFEKTKFRKTQKIFSENFHEKFGFFQSCFSSI